VPSDAFHQRVPDVEAAAASARKVNHNQ